MDLKFQTQIDRSGRVTLPPELLSNLQLSPEMNLLISEKDGKITLEPIADEPMLIEKDGILVLHAQLTDDLSNIVEKERQKRIAALIEDSYR
ncbi:AbrB/MazE/SpoVT family DNA-binding domain-containing protein [candidate division KSB1 bacterium]|nr:AbrB/MazE/SpoVT family DNA-binding domain-containing protein [candidate division KSB1 bacterium]